MSTDVEALLGGWLPTKVAGLAGTRTPADPQGTYSWLPFHKIVQVGGTGRMGIDAVRVNVETFAASYGAASVLSRAVRGAFQFQLIGYSAEGGHIIDVDTTSMPSWAPYEDTNVSRFLGVYTLRVHDN